jgi:hypothetical protein
MTRYIRTRGKVEDWLNAGEAYDIVRVVVASHVNAMSTLVEVHTNSVFGRSEGQY